jgi:DNA-binding NarL/FixJ family response regulator
MKLKVLIAEDQEVLRIGLRAILTADTRVSEVYEVRNERDLQQYLSGCELDLIVVNQDLLADISLLQEQNFVILAAEPQMAKLKAAYEYGACGYLSVNVSAELLCTMLRPSENTFLIEPTLVPIVMEYVFDRRITPTFNEILLTPREREIVCLLREGYDKSSIARKLCIAETTLKTHIKNIAKKRSKVVAPARMSR